MTSGLNFTNEEKSYVTLLSIVGITCFDDCFLQVKKDWRKEFFAIVHSSVLLSKYFSKWKNRSERLDMQLHVFEDTVLNAVAFCGIACTHNVHGLLHT